MGLRRFQAHQPRFTEEHKRTSSQAFKRPSMRQFVALDMSSRMGYCRMYNKQRRKNDQRNNKSRLSSRWRETGRGKENCRQIPASQNTGDAAATTSLPHIGSQVHRDRIPGPSKSSQQWSSSRICLELITPAREQRANHPHRKGSAQACERSSVQAHERPSKQARIADQSSSAQAFERTSESPDSVTAELS